MAQDNSFDIVSKVDIQEVRNAIDQAIKEIRQRFDLKDTQSEVNLEANDIELASANEYKLEAVKDILCQKLVKRGVSLKNLTFGKVEPATGQSVRQKLSLQQGIPSEKAKEIVRLIKDSKKKAQASIQGDTVRVSSKDRDELQSIIALLRAKEMGLELQFTNYRTNYRSYRSLQSGGTVAFFSADAIESENFEHTEHCDGKRGLRTATGGSRCGGAGAWPRCRIQCQHHHRDC